MNRTRYRLTRSPSSTAERGSVTAEFALALPGVVLVLGPGMGFGRQLCIELDQTEHLNGPAHHHCGVGALS